MIPLIAMTETIYVTCPQCKEYAPAAQTHHGACIGLCEACDDSAQASQPAQSIGHLAFFSGQELLIDGSDLCVASIGNAFKLDGVRHNRWEGYIDRAPSVIDRILAPDQILGAMERFDAIMAGKVSA